MPRAPRMCARPGCDETTTRRYCPHHTPTNWGTNRTRTTTTTAHKRWRRAVLARDHNHCQLRLTGCTGYATHADHITPIAEGGAEYDTTNGQAACEHCHEVKSTQERHRGYERYTNARRPDPPPY